MQELRACTADYCRPMKRSFAHRSDAGSTWSKCRKYWQHLGPSLAHCHLCLSPLRMGRVHALLRLVLVMSSSALQRTQCEALVLVGFYILADFYIPAACCAKPGRKTIRGLFTRFIGGYYHWGNGEWLDMHSVVAEIFH